MHKRGAYSLILVSLITLLSACGSSEAINTENTSVEENYGVEEANWAPEGFNEWDENVAWKWVDREPNCADCIFWHIQILTQYGCPNGVYGSINISKNDEVIDWTNDSVPYLAPGQKAVLAFEKYSLSGSGNNYEGALTELNCR